MAQGSGLKKLKKAPKSAGSQKRKVVRSKTIQSKGRKQFNARRANAIEATKPQLDVTKQINKKNEAYVAAKAIASGTNFSLKDIAERGTKEHKQQLKARDKKQDKSNKMTGRLKDQIQKLQQGTKTK